MMEIEPGSSFIRKADGLLFELCNRMRFRLCDRFVEQCICGHFKPEAFISFDSMQHNSNVFETRTKAEEIECLQRVCFPV